MFASEPRHLADAVTRLPHADLDGREVWLQRSAYFDGRVDYWYAFAGDPDAGVSGARRTAATEAMTEGIDARWWPLIEARDLHSY